MPQLKAYTDNSAKSGHYILANVGGSHPITIQVTDLGEKILQKAGYDTEDNIPTKIVWSMFDVGILYTSGTINDLPESIGDPDETFHQLGVANKLTAQEQNQLLNYLDEYTGPNQAEINDLRQNLEQSAEITSSETSVPEDVQDDLDRLSNLYDRGDLTTEEYELLKSRILDTIPSTATSHKVPDRILDTNSSNEQLQFDLKQELRSLVPEGKYDDANGVLELEDKSTDDLTIVFIDYSSDEHGFTYTCFFHDQGQEERMFELLDTDQWNLIIDNSDDVNSPSVMITRSRTDYGFRDELPDEYLEDDLGAFLPMIQTVYQTELSDLAKY